MLQQIIIQGGVPLNGEINISGAKNAALPLLASCLLTEHNLHLDNVPLLADVQTMLELLESFGVEISQNKNKVTLRANNINNLTASYELVSKMRASIVVLGPLLSRFKKAKVSLPGGCAIGTRPVDIHLSGLQQMGAIIEIDQGYINAKAPHGLTGTNFTMPLVSVTGTENLMMAATLAKGKTTLINAAREPEVIDLANCLNAMGAQITGFGTDTIIIEGVESLNSVQHTVMADRIETGTYAIAAIITGGKLHLKQTSLSLIPSVESVLKRVGAKLTETIEGFSVEADQHPIQGVDVMTEPFPGFATDLQAQWMALMCLCDGAAMVTETIFENRFMHVQELCRMGANITVHGASALVRGIKKLSGAPVMATDLRASCSLVLAGLAAQGETIVRRVYHLDRGYESIEEKLNSCGARMERLKAG